MGFMTLLGPALGLLGGALGGGNAQNAASGQMLNTAANQYSGLANQYAPYIGSSLSTMNKAATTGYSPQTYSAGMQNAIRAGDQNIAAARNTLGSGVSNIKAQTGDMLNSNILGEAGVSAQLAGGSQAFQEQAAHDLASMGTQATEASAAGLTGIGEDYQQAASASGNPFMNLLNMATMFMPGGQLGSIGSGIGGIFGKLFSGGGGGLTAPSGGWGSGIGSLGIPSANPIATLGQPSPFSPAGAMGGGG